MANTKGFKSVANLAGSPEWQHFDYDFTKDGGAQGVLNMAQVNEATLILDAFAEVLVTAAGASGTLKMGVTGNDDAFLTATTGAVAALTTTAGIVQGDSAGKQIKMTTSDYVYLTIGTTDFTAGKVRLWLLVKKQN